MTIRFVDLFAGIGGIRLGFEAVGWKCVMSSEIDKYAQITYNLNFPDPDNSHPFYEDVTQIDASRLPDFDVLAAGFPCQPFSSIGKMRGFEDTRGTLFFDIARIIKSKQPRIVFLENVRNLSTHDNGHTFAVIKETLNQLGYIVHSTIFNAKDFGVPQHRARIYIIGFKYEDDSDNFKFPIPPKTSTSLRYIFWPALEDRYNDYQEYTISNRQWESTQARRLRPAKGVTGFPGKYQLVNATSPYTSTLIAGYAKDHTQILVDQSNILYPLELTPYTDSGRVERLKNPANPRRVTPRECARLQGFPETFQIDVSDVQAYKQFGNSVAVPVIEAIAREINKILVDI